MFRLLISRWNSRPLVPGIRMSSSRHPGTSNVSFLARKSSIDANESVVNPTDPSRSSSEARTDGSSSMIKTTPRLLSGSAVFMTPLANGRQFEFDARATRYVWLGADVPAVRFDDRATDGEAHAQATFLGRVEGVEKSIARAGIDARPPIADRDDDVVGFIFGGAQEQLPPPHLNRTQRLNGVDNKVDEYLL